MNTKLENKIKDLREKIEAKREANSGIIHETAANRAERLLVAVEKELATGQNELRQKEVDLMCLKLDQLFQGIEVLAGLMKQVADRDSSVKIENLADIIIPELPKELRIANLKDLAAPVVNMPEVKFPAEIQAKILQTVETYDLIPVDTTFEYDRLHRVSRIVEQYPNFQVVTNYERKGPNGKLSHITSEARS